jgi:putative oxygen-independent coproporphyrinogen III oxidase
MNSAARPLASGDPPGAVAPPVPDIPLALYVHMPWCVRKCPYCDFNSHQLKSPVPSASYIDALIRDFDTELPFIAGRRIDTVFFGGGTPSLFGPDDFMRLLQALRQRIAFADDAEITLEANPGTIERGSFAGYRDAGINRVSLGAQSFAPRALERLGRIHRVEDTHRAVEELRGVGIENFNLDLMYALPEQTLEEALFDVRTACALGPAHMSYYQLTLEPGTVFHARPPALPDQDAAWMIQVECQELLAAEGFEQYEVSAYAKEGARCRHNLNYWLFGDYVGVGAGAHGKLSINVPEGILRTAKPKQPREYQDSLRMPPTSIARTAMALTPIGERKQIAPAELPFEFMLNALRLNEGFGVREFELRTGLRAAAVEPGLEEARNRGFIEVTDRGWRPTELGRKFLNDLQAGFLA